MASFSLLMTQSPFQTDSHFRAIDFIEAACAAGHSVDRVFFYQDAVLCANDRSTPPQGQQSVAQHWIDCSQRHHVPLHVCIANAIRRGVVNHQESDRYNLPGPTMPSGFELTGLGEMADATRLSDRLVTF